MLADPDHVEPETVREDRLLDDVAHDGVAGQQVAVGVSGDVAEGVDAELHVHGQLLSN